MLKNRYARQTLALFTSARAIHRDPSRPRGLAPGMIATEAGVAAGDAVRARDNRPLDIDAAERLFAWNGLDLARVMGSDPEGGRT